MKLSLLLCCLLVLAPASITTAFAYSFPRDASITISGKTVPVDSTKQRRKMPCTTCPEGVGSHEGDEPLLRWGFSNAETLLVCGYVDSTISKVSVLTSEFEVINCHTGAILCQTSALEPRIIEGKPDLLELTQMVSLPTGSNWAYRDYPLQQWYLKPSGDSVVPSAPNFVFKRPTLGKQWVRHALATCDSLVTKIRKPDNPFDYPYDFYLDLLFTCMIAGSQEAERQFLALPGEHIMDGAFSEMYHMTQEVWNLIKDQARAK